MRRLGEICDKADGYCEEAFDDQADADGEMYAKVWTEAAAMRASGELLQRFAAISCPLTLIQGDVDPHPAEGVISPLREKGMEIRSFVIAHCGHTPWQERYAREQFADILFSELERTWRQARTPESSASP